MATKRRDGAPCRAARTHAWQTIGRRLTDAFANAGNNAWQSTVDSRRFHRPPFSEPRGSVFLDGAKAHQYHTKPFSFNVTSSRPLSLRNPPCAPRRPPSPLFLPRLPPPRWPPAASR
ncbi:hypothetical protein C2U35_16930, partial [Ralstonia solanacearum]